MSRTKLADLFLRTTQDGKQYFTGPAGHFQFEVWPNEYAQTDQDPQFAIYTSEIDQSRALANKSTSFSKPRTQTNSSVDYEIKIGKHKGKKLSDVKPAEIKSYIAFLENKARSEGKGLTGPMLELANAVKARYGG